MSTELQMLPWFLHIKYEKWNEVRLDKQGRGKLLLTVEVGDPLPQLLLVGGGLLVIF